MQIKHFCNSLLAKPLLIKVFMGLAVLLFIPGLAELKAQDVGNITKENPFEIHGSVSVGAGYYLSKGFNTTRKPYTYSINAAPEISVYGVKIPFNFTFTEGSKSVSNPFAQFGINPYWKWIKGYFVYTNMKWSPTTLNGKTFLGAGIEINPSLFRMGAFYGILNPVLKENLLGPNTQQPQYKRKGWGLKVGVGNQNNYFDFIWVHGKDVANSIAKPTDILNQLNVTPAENAIFGIASHQMFAKNAVTWDLDAAASAYTRDLNSQLVDIGTGIGTKFLKVAIPPRLSTSYAWTAHTFVGYKTDSFSLGFDYNRIQPEYQSMGVDYILNDQEKITLTQTFVAAKKKLNVAFMEFFQRDDLNKRKSVKTNRLGVNASFSYNHNQNFGFNINYNNFTILQQDGLKELNDTTKIFQLQNTFAFIPRYTFINTKLVQNILLAVTYTRLDDLNDFTAKYSRNSTVNTNISYSAMVLKAQLSITPSLNIMYSKTTLFDLLNVGPTLALSKTWWKGKISTTATTTFTMSRNNKLWNSKTVNNSISLGYRITKNHSIKYNNGVTHSWLSYGTTSEYKGELIYTYVFDYVVKNKKEQQKNF